MRNIISKFNECWIPDYAGIKNLSGDLGQVTDKNIQKTMIGYFYSADRDYGMRLAKALGFTQKDFMH